MEAKNESIQLKGQETMEAKRDSIQCREPPSENIESTEDRNIESTEDSSDNQGVALARERNDRNRDHLSTAFRVYKQLYGEEAAREAFIEIASSIANEENHDSQIDIFTHPSHEESTSSNKAAVDGPTTPRYMTYRKSLSSQKDRSYQGDKPDGQFSDHNRQYQHNSLDAELKEPSPSSIVSYNDNELNRDDAVVDLVYAKKPPSQLYHSAASQLYHSAASFIEVEPSVHADQASADGDTLQASSSVEATASSVYLNTSLHGVAEPPKYIKYRASLSLKSASSIPTDNVNVPQTFPASVIADDRNLVDSVISSSPHITTANAHPIVEGPTEIVTARSEATNESETLPLYVKYRASLSTKNRRDVPSQSQPSKPDVSAISRSSSSSSNFVIVNTSNAATEGSASGNPMSLSNDQSINDDFSTASSGSSNRYMNYRSKLKDKPWKSLQIPQDIPESPTQSTHSYHARSLQSGGTHCVTPDRITSKTSQDAYDGASAATILSDLHSVEQVIPPTDDKTLTSASTEASPKTVSVAEQLLRSSSESEEDEDTAADQSVSNSFAGHSVATPIISNSAHKKLLRAPAYLPYEGSSSFESDSNSEANLIYMANVPKTAVQEPANDTEDSAKVSPSSSSFVEASNEIGDVRIDESNQNNTAETAELHTIPIASEDASDEVVSDEYVSASKEMPESSPNQRAAFVGSRDTVTDSDSSSDSSSSSSDSNSDSSSSASNKQIAPLSLASNLNNSYDSELVVPAMSKENVKSDDEMNDGVSNSTPNENKGGILSKTYDSGDASADEGNDSDVEAQRSVGTPSQALQLKASSEKKQSKALVQDAQMRNSRWFGLIFFLIVAIPISITLGILYSNRDPTTNVSTDPPAQVPTNTPMQSPPTYITIQPSLSPSTLFLLLSSRSSDNGTAIATPGTPQNTAFLWLSNDPSLQNYSETRKVQRFALTTFFYSTNGNNWTENQGWATYTNECDWFTRSTRFDTCEENGEFFNLDLAFNKVSGTLPPDLGMLTKLSRVILSGGFESSLIGTIPSELGSLRGMVTFLAQGNSLYGKIPTELGDWGIVETLDLSMNNLLGNIPTTIGFWQSLRFLDFGSNRFEGTIPSTLVQLTNLERLSFGDNKLTGTIPSSIDLLTSLKVINLEKNRIAGIPTQLGNVSMLETLTLDNNELLGRLITELGNLVVLQRLSLNTNSLTGPIPSEIGNITTLRYLDLSSNGFTGSIPTEIGQLSDMFTLELKSNRLSGNVPTEFDRLSNASLIRIDSNNITGTVPSQVCDAFTVTFPTFYADCAGGANATLVCADLCCTFCCNTNGVCNCTLTGTAYEFLCYP